MDVFWQDPDRRGVVLSESDIPASAVGSLVVSKRGKDMVEPRFGEFVEFLPLDSQDLDLWAMHVLPSVSAIDVKRSRALHKDIDCATLEPIGPQIGITEPYAFHDSVVASLPVFRDVEWRHGWFMTQPFVEFMRSAGLSGFDARLIYDSELDNKGFARSSTR